MREPIPIPLKPTMSAIPTDNEELRELGEDLRVMACEGLLAHPWDHLDVDVLRECKFEKGNQWLNTKTRDPESWNPDTWASRSRVGRLERWPVRWKIPRGCRS